MSEFQGQVAVVTGAAGNVGTALCNKLAAAAASIALLDRDPDAMARVLNGLPAGANAASFAVDLLDADSVSGCIADVQKRFGRIDILANVAGGFAMGPTLDETDDATWNLMLDLNARSVFHTARAVLPLMRAGGYGRIVNVAARAALKGQGHMGPYCASKAAVMSLTESMAAETKHLDINVNCILPGTVDTPQNRAAMPDADHDTWVPPEALADVMLFLASNAARCVSGAAVPVYGRS
ncbi:MAG: SDR family oxidoreductase [Thiohalocapsa sp.]|jgi:NAD(P)-dependent dehydrogenase (short-subunit alcohol dehydrogenase family)|uniref:SDR family oxidoreductase n=1 Tax=Thiohalocapsa sp. TaxID=2497641 RepID=UPI0025CC2BD7|nr:SDR family NAD(P)-dependent oxidoreductase [Thiohalocapsa sp.]MCG6940361.1 SDR family oxidoreductase [Thiohalocapsa sp.]